MVRTAFRPPMTVVMMLILALLPALAASFQVKTHQNLPHSIKSKSQQIQQTIVLRTAKNDDNDDSALSFDDISSSSRPAASFLRSWRSRIFQRHSLSTSKVTQQQPLPSLTSPRRRTSPLQKLGKTLMRWKWARGVVAAALLGGGSAMTLYPTVAHASAPVMALPKADQRDPATDAMLDHQRRMAVKAQAELRQFAEQARKIEAEQGEAARIQFERNYKQQQEQMAQQKLQQIEQVKRDLLDQGIDPFCDLEGRRQVILQESGLDLGQVPGTPYNMELDLQKRNSPQSFAARHAVQRQIIKCMVQDLKNRQQDPLPYFVQHQDQTATILDMPTPKAMVLLQQYQNNLQQYGQVVPPKEGELSALQLQQLEAERQMDPAVQKQKQKEAQRAAKEAAAAERAAKQLQQQQERAKAKEQAQAAKEQAKLEKEQAKAQAAAAAAAVATAAATSAAAAATTASTAVGAVEGMVPASTTTEMVQTLGMEGEGAAAGTGASNELATTEPVQMTLSPGKTSSQLQLPIKVTVGVVAVAGGAYGVQMYREKSARDEEERQRQFRLLMGWDQDDKTTKRKSETSVLDSSDSLLDGASPDDEPQAKATLIDGDKEATVKDTSDAAAIAAELEATKKRKLGIKSVFKRKADRETDLSVLISPDAKAPEFALLLAKVLTAGAPGRFPHVVSLPGAEVSPTLDLESAKQLLIESRTGAGLSLEESAEIFANVVNCMLIDIVDLASTSLKEKEEQATVEAIRIVVDFMNYAASLYDSVAESVAITPVTYSGTLSKSKLEQMYSAYALSAMSDMSQLDDTFESRVRLLQDVFQINEKKADGLVMKAMQKNMVKMMKTGEGMENMQAMMKGMGAGDMGDMASLLGDPNGGDAPNPEQLKEMLLALKQLKDSGSIPPQELETVKAQFREAFGSSIDEVMRDADENQDAMTAGDKELLELMKDILND